eukprot:2391001-Pleurochrysis_carterae.AAC.2
MHPRTSPVRGRKLLHRLQSGMQPHASTPTRHEILASVSALRWPRPCLVYSHFDSNPQQQKATCVRQTAAPALNRAPSSSPPACR